MGADARGGMAGELAALAEQGASGTLEIGGDPGGVIYLSDGYLAFAESSAAPDLFSRLVNSRRLPTDQWSQADVDTNADDCAGDLLVRRGLIDAGEWEILLRSAILDTLVVLALQLAAGPPAEGTRFTSTRSRRAGCTLRLDAGTAWEYAWDEAGRLAGYHVAPDTRLRMCRRARPRLDTAAAAHAVLSQIDGRATVRDLAWRNGLALYGVMSWIVRLIQDGVCAVDGPQSGRAIVRVPQYPDGMVARWVPPAPEVLEKVLAGLRRLT